MFIVNLVASVLALAMVGASTASLSKVDSNTLGSDVVLNRDVHRAYYDPDDTSDYPTENSDINKIFNFTSYDLVPCSDTGTSDVSLAFEPDSYLRGGWGAFQGNSDLSLADPINDEWEYDWFYFGNWADLGSFSFSESLNISVQIVVARQNTTAPYDWVFEDCGILSPTLVDGGYLFTGVIDDSGYIHDFDDVITYIFDVAFDPYTPVDMLGDIAEGLTGGIVPVAEGIGDGLQSLVQDIFLNADHDGLSVFGLVIICFAGLALALGLSRWVLNFVDTLGARDR